MENASITQSLVGSAQVVHILLYNDPKASYVGLDVFASYDAAFRQFQQRLKETEEEHPEDEEWIELFTAQCGNDDLYFRDKDGYEVLYMCENVQEGDE